MLNSLRRLVLLGAPRTAPARCPRTARESRRPRTAELLQQRRARLLGVGDGVASSRRLRPRSVEGDYPGQRHRESNDFFYLTGLETPGASLVHRTYQRAGLKCAHTSPSVILPRRCGRGRVSVRSGGTRATGVDGARAAQFSDDVAGWLGGGRAALFVDVPMARRAECGGQPQGGPECAPILRTLRVPEGTRVASISEHIAALRLIKDGDELRRLREAIRITAEAHRAAAAALGPGVWGTRSRRSSVHVPAHGRRARRLPEHRRRAVLDDPPLRPKPPANRAGDLVVIDIGAGTATTRPISRTYRSPGASPSGSARSMTSCSRPSRRPSRPCAPATIGELTRVAREH